MTGNPRNRKIKLAFETTSLRIPLAEIEMLRVMTTSIKKSIKFGQIAASIREVGIIEPPVVVRIKGQRDHYRLLDGHIRIEILKERGDKDVVRSEERRGVIWCVRTCRCRLSLDHETKKLDK